MRRIYRLLSNDFGSTTLRGMPKRLTRRASAEPLSRWLSLLAAALTVAALPPAEAQGKPSAKEADAAAYRPKPSSFSEAEVREARRLELPPRPVVVVIPIEGMIDLGLSYFLRKGLEQAEEKNAGLVVLDINTLGGRVDAAIQMRDALLTSQIPVVAFIHRRAISAGALISLACDVIVVSPGASMGAATPIQIGQDNQAQPVAEKMVSYMRSEMRATAEANKRRGEVAEAMVDAAVEVKGVSQAGKLLTLDATGAMELGMADVRADSLNALFRALEVRSPRVVRAEITWAERLTRFLTDPTVSGMLMSLGTLMLMIDLYTAGFGLLGFFGLASLGLFFGGHLLVHLAGWEEMLLMAAGLVLLAAEVFVIPGFGIAGIAGFLLLLAAFVMALIGLPLDVSFAAGLLTRALSRVALSIMLTAAAMIAAFRWLPRRFRGGALVLAAEQPAHDGYTMGSSDLKALVGLQGVTETELRPAGKVLVAERRYDVVSYGGYVARGVPVRVTQVEGSRIVVEPSKPL